MPKIVNFSKPLIFEFEGNICKNALCLGDVDNDGLNELVVGNDKGDLALFKEDNPKPLRWASELGLITAISIGDLLNNGRNVLVVITACGNCYIYDFHQDPLHLGTERQLMKPVHVQTLPANVKSLLIGDINGDGFAEMALALTDRVVRTYKWVDSSNSVGGVPKGKLIGQNKWELSDQIGGIAINRSEGSATLLVAQPGGTCFTLNPPPDNETDQFHEKMTKLLTKMSNEFDSLDSASFSNPKIQTEICGNIELEEETTFSKFKAASALNKSMFETDMQNMQDGTAYVLATVDGTVMLVRDRKILWKLALDYTIISISQLLVPNKNKRCDSMEDLDTKEMDPDISKPFMLEAAGFVPCSSRPVLMPQRSYTMKSNPSTPSKMPIPIPNSKPKYISNTRKYGQPMTTKIVACSNDGTSFIINISDGCFCVFNFKDNVNTCSAGFYGYRGMQMPCIAYTSYTNEIFLYHDVSSCLEARPKLMDLLKGNLGYVEAVRKLGIDLDDREQVRKLHDYLMYSFDDYQP